MPPYVARSNTELYKMHRENTPQAIHKVFREIPKGLENLIIKQCMAKKPSDRPQSMKDILEKLNAIRKKHHIPLV
jgi:serine/threonine-protein kinase